jgi:hypothetical protein
MNWLHPDLEQVVRICRGGTVRANDKQADVDRLKGWVATHGGGIDIHYSPPASGVPAPIDDLGMADYNVLVKNNIKQLQTLLGQTPVRRVLFDFESWVTGTDPEHNQKMQDWYEIWRDMMLDAFPGAIIEWYGYGSVTYGASETGFAESRWFPYLAPPVSHSSNVSLYSLWEYRQGITSAFKTLAGGRTPNGKLIPWVSLGAGYVRQLPNSSLHKYEISYDYPRAYSHLAGMGINHPWANAEIREERYGPFRHTEFACFYPGALNAATLFWKEHFIQYVRGAHNITS